MRSTLKAALIAMLGIGAGLAARALRQVLRASREGEREDGGAVATPSSGGADVNGAGAAAERGAVAAGPTRAQLYEEAKRRGIRGRSQMTKAQLAEALDRDTQD